MELENAYEEDYLDGVSMESDSVLTAHDPDFRDLSVDVGQHVVTHEEVMADASKRFNYLLQTFVRAGRMKTKGNDLMIVLYFHAVMGAYLKHYTILKPGGASDLRVPIIWVQNSGSGKSQLNKYAMDVCNQVGITAAVQTEFTTAGMIGTFDKEKHSYNLKNSLSPGDSRSSVYNGQTTVKSYMKPVVYGDMYYYDIIFIDEGKILFQGSRNTENVLSILQPAMDYPGKVRKKLAASEAIEYDCDCTLVTSTVEFDTLGGEIMYQGFFQRCLFYSRKLTVFDYSRMLDDLTRSEFSETKYTTLINNFGEAIESHEDPIIRDRHKITVDYACNQLITNTTQNWLRVIKDTLYGNDLKLAQSFVSRMNMFIYKLAGQVAVINNQRNPADQNLFVIKPSDVEYAIRLINPLFNNLVNSFGTKETPHEKKLLDHAIAIMQRMLNDKTETLTKGEMVVLIMELSKTGRQKAARIYDNLIDSNLLEQKYEKDRKLRVVPNWKLWVSEQQTYKKLGKQQTTNDNLR